MATAIARMIGASAVAALTLLAGNLADVRGF